MDEVPSPDPYGVQVLGYATYQGQFGLVPRHVCSLFGVGRETV